MFIGHFALAFATQQRGKFPSLAISFIAAQLLDLVWPILVLTGVETFEVQAGNTILTPLAFTHYPYSHSLLMAVGWSLLFSIGYFLFTRNKSGSVLLCLLVISHWLLDYITHRADLQLSPFSETRVGLGLWNHPAAEIILETSMFVIGVLLYHGRVKPKRKAVFWTLVIFFIAIHFMNMFGPPPPSVTIVAWSANLMWVFVLWAWWLEKENRHAPGHDF